MKPSILVVDDDQDILWTVSEILADEGFPVRIARNGEEGLIVYARETPDLILLDLWMPQMDGLEMARRLERTGSSVPIVVMSAMQTGREVAEEINAAGYIPKPFDIDILIAEVQRLVDRPEKHS